MSVVRRVDREGELTPEEVTECGTRYAVVYYLEGGVVTGAVNMVVSGWIAAHQTNRTACKFQKSWQSFILRYTSSTEDYRRVTKRVLT